MAKGASAGTARAKSPTSSITSSGDAWASPERRLLFDQSGQDVFGQEIAEPVETSRVGVVPRENRDHQVEFRDEHGVLATVPRRVMCNHGTPLVLELGRLPNISVYFLLRLRWTVTYMVE